MKSPMVENAGYITNKSGYTELRVLKSAAGYYIGTMYEERDEDGKLKWQEPGSRDSEYFRTEEAAAKVLKYMEGSGDTDFCREHP